MAAHVGKIAMTPRPGKRDAALCFRGRLWERLRLERWRWHRPVVEAVVIAAEAKRGRHDGRTCWRANDEICAPEEGEQACLCKQPFGSLRQLLTPSLRPLPPMRTAKLLAGRRPVQARDRSAAQHGGAQHGHPPTSGRVGRTCGQPRRDARVCFACSQREETERSCGVNSSPYVPSGQLTRTAVHTCRRLRRRPTTTPNPRWDRRRAIQTRCASSRRFASRTVRPSSPQTLPHPPLPSAGQCPQCHRQRDLPGTAAHCAPRTRRHVSSQLPACSASGRLAEASAAAEQTTLLRRRATSSPLPRLPPRPRRCRFRSRPLQPLVEACALSLQRSAVAACRASTSLTGLRPFSPSPRARGQSRMTSSLQPPSRATPSHRCAPSRLQPRLGPRWRGPWPSPLSACSSIAEPSAKRRQARALLQREEETWSTCPRHCPPTQTVPVVLTARGASGWLSQ